jgi:DNA primase
VDPTIEEIKRRADIVDVVSQHVALRPAGGERWKACCPFHDEKTPSFYVSRDKGFFKCFGCGAAGDIFKFLQRVENISFPKLKSNWQSATACRCRALAKSFPRAASCL